MGVPILMTTEETCEAFLPAYAEYAGGTVEMMLLDERECPLGCGERDEDCGETCVPPRWSEMCEGQRYG